MVHLSALVDLVSLGVAIKRHPFIHSGHRHLRQAFLRFSSVAAVSNLDALHRAGIQKHCPVVHSLQSGRLRVAPQSIHTHLYIYIYLK